MLAKWKDHQHYNYTHCKYTCGWELGTDDADDAIFFGIRLWFVDIPYTPDSHG